LTLNRLCDMHCFSPAEVNPIVEVIKAPRTASETMAPLCCHFWLDARRKPSNARITADLPSTGFSAHTQMKPRCLDDGLGSPTQIDEVAKEVLGVPVGPFFVMNIVKANMIEL